MPTAQDFAAAMIYDCSVEQLKQGVICDDPYRFSPYTMQDVSQDDCDTLRAATIQFVQKNPNNTQYSYELALAQYFETSFADLDCMKDPEEDQGYDEDDEEYSNEDIIEDYIENCASLCAQHFSKKHLSSLSRQQIKNIGLQVKDSLSVIFTSSDKQELLKQQGLSPDRMMCIANKFFIHERHKPESTREQDGLEDSLENFIYERLALD